MQHDLPLRAAARAVYGVLSAVADELVVGFEDAERYRTDLYRHAVDAALRARAALASFVEQPCLL